MDAGQVRRELAEAGASDGSTCPTGEQARLDALIVNALDIEQDSLFNRFGYRPARWSLWTLFSHQFLHRSTLHLLLNLWLLWLVGCNLEVRPDPGCWRRCIYVGAAAALTHQVCAPHSSSPLIGASGAIAGLFGALLTRHSAARLQLGAWIGVRVVRFWVPAYVALLVALSSN